MDTNVSDINLNEELGDVFFSGWRPLVLVERVLKDIWEIVGVKDGVWGWIIIVFWRTFNREHTAHSGWIKGTSVEIV